ncbi:DUF4178 domain-containing protein [Methylibium sp. T29]|uniref:DUF4178 domain-containing protein n=1 Tax=Methylibium sp. T29 TaxID=1430884 RepID=UPI0003F3D81D|nr:hypothetical protein X551_03291 [Methylibium sp. T29]
MATDPSPQRAYRAACPNCGAAVEFRSAASALAVCSYCRSTLLREGDALRRIGQSAELFDDHSPLQLGTAGRWQGAAFTLVGRLQVRYAGGSWNEWHALFDSADPTDAAPRSGWLSEDNGGYVFGFEAPAPPEALPPPEALRVGAQQVLGRESWSVASVTTARLGAAEGELPFVPVLERAYVVAELRNARGEVASIDYGPASEGRPPRWYVGRGLQLAELTLSGLREDGSTRDLKGRTLACPSCGASVAVQLDSTQSIVCAQCHAVVDLGAPGAQGAGADLKHYAQDTPGVAGGEPLIALGRSGTLTLGAGGPLPWQVVGYVERCTLPEAGDDEQSFWREYLLYNRQAGFAFLVDAEDGWSWVRPLTGAPQVSGATARWQGDSYREIYRYSGQITYVLGEFYWRLARGERTRNTDYRGPGGKQLNREQTGEGGDARSPGRPARRSTPTCCSRPSSSTTASAPRCSATPSRCRQRASAAWPGCSSSCCSLWSSSRWCVAAATTAASCAAPTARPATSIRVARATAAAACAARAGPTAVSAPVAAGTSKLPSIHQHRSDAS